MTVSERLFSEPWEFEFFEAVRLLEVLYPGRTPPGEQADPEREAVRLKSIISFVFAASEIQSLKKPETEDSPALMMVNLFSVGGVRGPLPQADSDRVIEQSYLKNPAFGEFLDMFHHRILSLLVRMRKLHHPSYIAGPPHQGPVAPYLYALFGMGTPAMRDRLQMPQRSLLLYSGLLAQHPRSSSGLECLLSDYYQTPARVSPPRGRWHELENHQLTRLGESGGNRELGRGAMLGTRVWNQQGRFEVALGPMSFRLFLDLLPRGSGYQPLCELIRFYSGPDLEFGFRLTLRAAEVPASRLGASRLGWTSWIRTRPFTHDDSQVRLSSRRPADPFAKLDLQSLLRS